MEMARGAHDVDGLRGRAVRRLPALVALAVTLVLGLNYSLWWPDVVHHNPGFWAAPADLWGTYLASVNAIHGHFSQIYVTRTNLESFPGIVWLLAPMTAVGNALHLELGPNLTAFSEPTAWVLAGPYELVLAAVPFFACDAIAERWRMPSGRRVVLALLEASLVANVTIRWGHPEDAVALGLVLYAALDADSERWTRCAWLAGLAICIQPFAIVALTPLFARLHWRSIKRLIAPIVLPSAVVLAGPLIANWHNTVHILANQPNYPTLNHPTPWTSLLPRLDERLVAVPSGPGRAVAVVLALTLGFVVCKTRYRLEVVLVMIAVGVMLRLLGESVLDSFYTWPVLAVGVLLAARRGPLRLGTAGALGLFITWFSNVSWRGVWPWWIIVIGSLVAVLAISWPERGSFAAPVIDENGASTTMSNGAMPNPDQSRLESGLEPQDVRT